MTTVDCNPIPPKDEKSDASDLAQLLLKRYSDALFSTGFDGLPEAQGALIGCVEAAKDFEPLDSPIAVARETLQEQIGEDGCVEGTYAIISESLFKITHDIIPPRWRFQIDGITRMGFENLLLSNIVIVNPIGKS